MVLKSNVQHQLAVVSPLCMYASLTSIINTLEIGHASFIVRRQKELTEQIRKLD